MAGKDLQGLMTLIEKDLFGHSAGFEFSRIAIVTLIFTGVFLVISLSDLLSMMNTKKIRSRKTYYLLLWVFIISLIIYFVLPSVSIEIVWLTGIPASYFLSHYLIFVRKKIIPEILISVFFILVLLIQVLYLK